MTNGVSLSQASGLRSSTSSAATTGNLDARLSHASIETTPQPALTQGAKSSTTGTYDPRNLQMYIDHSVKTASKTSLVGNDASIGTSKPSSFVESDAVTAQSETSNRYQNRTEYFLKGYEAYRVFLKKHGRSGTWCIGGHVKVEDGVLLIYTRNKGQDNEVNEKYDASSDPYKLYVEKLAADQIQLCGMKGTEFTVDMIWAGKCPIQKDYIEAFQPWYIGKRWRGELGDNVECEPCGLLLPDELHEWLESQDKVKEPSESSEAPRFSKPPR